jgi:hypothetical protein
MIDSKAAIRTILINNAPLIALVPVARIIPTWLTDTTTLPCICYRTDNQLRQDPDYFDDVPQSETALVRFDIFQAANTSAFAIESALDTVMVANSWNLESRADVQDPSGAVHVSLLYSQRLYT